MEKPLVVDLGVGQSDGQSGPEVSRSETLMPRSGSGSSETLPGKLQLGTPANMSPEQACGDLDRLGPRSDVYSLELRRSYCLLTGRGRRSRATSVGEVPPQGPAG